MQNKFQPHYESTMMYDTEMVDLHSPGKGRPRAPRQWEGESPVPGGVWSVADGQGCARATERATVSMTLPAQLLQETQVR